MKTAIYRMDAAVYGDGTMDLIHHQRHDITWDQQRQAMEKLVVELQRIIKDGWLVCPFRPKERGADGTGMPTGGQSLG